MIELKMGNYKLKLYDKNSMWDEEGMPYKNEIEESIWISKDDEGMQVSIYEIEKLLDKFWKENF